MNELYACPVTAGLADPGGFFSDQQSEWMQRSAAYSDEVHADPSVHNVASVMRRAYTDFIRQMPYSVDEEGYQDVESARAYNNRLLAAGAVRALLARNIGHYMAMELAPTAARLLNGDEEPLEAALREDPRNPDSAFSPGFNLVKSPDAAIVTDPAFNRTWHGDDARLIALTGLVMEPAVDRAYRRIPAGLHLGFAWACSWAEKTEGQKAERLELDLAQQQLFYADGKSVGGTWLLEHLVHTVIIGRRRVRPFLEHSCLETVSEHTGSYLSDLLHGFIPYENATPDDWVQAAISQMHDVSTLSFMPNKLNAEAEYKDRYVLGDTSGKGKYGSRREPLVLVKFDADTGRYRPVPNEESQFHKAHRGKRNKCSGSDPLEPTERRLRNSGITEIEASQMVRTALKRAVTDRDGNYLYDGAKIDPLDRNYSCIDMGVAIGSTVARGLAARGLATFDQEEVRRHLVRPEDATSSGARPWPGRKVKTP